MGDIECAQRKKRERERISFFFFFFFFWVGGWVGGLPYHLSSAFYSVVLPTGHGLFVGGAPVCFRWEGGWMVE